MSTENSQVHIKLPNAPELVGAVVGAAEYLAQRVGFDAAAQDDLRQLTEQACRNEVAALPTEDSTLDVTLEDFPDRVELTFEHETRAQVATAADYPLADRVEAEIRDGVSHLKLTKYAHARK
ncbi:MAG: hypothetical protein K6U09_11915 [Acidobacteriia bacterium]|nr:hypothetical protein [Terriglobia bacterium]